MNPPAALPAIGTAIIALAWLAPASKHGPVRPHTQSSDDAQARIPQTSQVDPRAVLDLMHAHYRGNLIHERINVTVNRWHDGAAAMPIDETSPASKPSASRASVVFLASVPNGPLMLRAGRLGLQWHDGVFAAAAAPPTDPDARPVFVLPASTADAVPEPQPGAVESDEHAPPSASTPSSEPLPELIARMPLAQIRLRMAPDHADFAQPAAFPDLRIEYRSALLDRAATPPIYRLTGYCASTGAAAHLEADARSGRLIRGVLRIPASRFTDDVPAETAEGTAPTPAGQSGRGGVVDLVTTTTALPSQSAERLIQTYGIDLDPSRQRVGDIRELFTTP